MLNLKIDVEMDAIVVDGRNLASAAVCGLQGCAIPCKWQVWLWKKVLYHAQDLNDQLEVPGQCPRACESTNWGWQKEDQKSLNSCLDNFSST
ncbi:hypothetical protein PoB_004747200 [Plakobranchus ocellatus]|uniref:Uncharacterized protein n=1 Tax=Plakobranchus ocellatus TaxID=259542 RepID=A0AAV4BNM1_9GAST|nr:hypothetical protein PoB_004747200 [Plakobranchus ocellatus]